jgi:hypothetical protein
MARIMEAYEAPVCPLVLALYGHPDAGGYWEQLCDSHLRDCGFFPIAAEDKAWRSCYWSPSLSCYMIVYVDDFKISGPEDNIKKARQLIRAENARTGKPGIVLDDPTPAGQFLGCNHVVSEDWGPPMSKDRTPMTKLPTEEEYNNYHAGAPPDAQTTKPDATKCTTNYQAAHDDDRANYNAVAPLDAQTTKPDTTKCATNYQAGHDDDRANYNAGAPLDAQKTSLTRRNAPLIIRRGVTTTRPSAMRARRRMRKQLSKTRRNAPPIIRRGATTTRTTTMRAHRQMHRPQSPL